MLFTQGREAVLAAREAGARVRGDRGPEGWKGARGVCRAAFCVLQQPRSAASRECVGAGSVLLQQKTAGPGRNAEEVVRMGEGIAEHEGENISIHVPFFGLFPRLLQRTLPLASDVVTACI